MNSNDFVSKEKHEADIDGVLLVTDNLKERITDLKDSTSRQINLWGIAFSAMAALFALMQLGIALFLYMITRAELHTRRV